MKGRGLLARILSTKPLVWLGEISFALHLEHQVTMKWSHLMNIEGQMDPAGPVLVVGACIALAALLQHGVEVPLHARPTGRGPSFGKARKQVLPEAQVGYVPKPTPPTWRKLACHHLGADTLLLAT